MGESGSGKTTLLNILAALDKPTAGSVVLDGRELSKVGDADAAAFRRDNLGFVFQEFNLLDTFSLEDNIALPLVLAGKGYREINERLMPVARRLGIAELLKKYPYEVSGGQKQRAAVARAIITRPSLLLADEPTGALDSRSSDELLRLFGELTVAENIALKNDLTRFQTAERIDGLLGAAGIADKRDTPVGLLSFGQRQRVAFVRALCQPFDFMLLDEPVSHLDAANGEVLAELLVSEARRQGAGVIVTSVGNRLGLPYDKIFAL